MTVLAQAPAPRAKANCDPWIRLLGSSAQGVPKPSPVFFERKRAAMAAEPSCAADWVDNDVLPAEGRAQLAERQVPKGDVAVDLRLLGQAEHPLAEDVAHHLVGAAGDPRTGRSDHHP